MWTKPKMEVKHVWDPVALATRDSDWPDRQPRLNGPMYLQNRGTQMRGCLEYRGEPHTRSSRVIGSDPLCQRPERSRYARAKPFPDPAVHTRNAPDRCQAERRERELSVEPKPWPVRSRRRNRCQRLCRAPPCPHSASGQERCRSIAECRAPHRKLLNSATASVSVSVSVETRRSD